MITWKEYLIMQFLNTVTFLIIQEFFWLKMRKRFDGLLEKGKIATPRAHFQNIKQRIKDWRQRERDALVQSHKRVK